jgi:hydroxymethylpyrimidine pyrophosphatase-like HAD family hydrolase
MLTGEEEASTKPAAANTDTDCNNFDCILDRHIQQLENGNKNILQHNSRILGTLAEEILSNFKDVIVERKYITNNETLAGITIDWRQLRDWKYFKKTSEPLLKEAIENQQKLSFNGNTLYIQTYTTHPFIDVYAVKCDKGIAFDSVLSEISYIKGKGGQKNVIMYLGDSENDNPAFKKADVSIGVVSDNRLNPKLDCEYTVSFDQLPIFLRKLFDRDLVFSGNLLSDH